MQGLHLRLKYAVDIGLNYLSRNIDDRGRISNNEHLLHHCANVFCLAENTEVESEPIKRALSFISKNSYSQNNILFTCDNFNNSLTSVNALAGLAFASSGREDWAVKYATTIVNRQNSDGFISCDDKSLLIEDDSHIGQSVKLFTRLYELGFIHFFEKAKLSRDWIIKNGRRNNYWNMIALTYLRQHDDTDESEKWIIDSVNEHKDNLDVCAHYGLVFGGDWEENIAKMCEDRLKQQVPPSDLWNAGAFKEGEEIRLELSHRYISSFQQIVRVIDSQIQYNKL